MGRNRGGRKETEMRNLIVHTSMALDGVAQAPAAVPEAAAAVLHIRSTLMVNADRSGMTARWERSDDGARWRPWMYVAFTPDAVTGGGGLMPGRACPVRRAGVRGEW
jgi:hypothetical protein